MPASNRNGNSRNGTWIWFKHNPTSSAWGAKCWTIPLCQTISIHTWTNFMICTPISRLSHKETTLIGHIPYSRICILYSTIWKWTSNPTRGRILCNIVSIFIIFNHSTTPLMWTTVLPSALTITWWIRCTTGYFICIKPSSSTSPRLLFVTSTLNIILPITIITTSTRRITRWTWSIRRRTWLIRSAIKPLTRPTLQSSTTRCTIASRCTCLTCIPRSTTYSIYRTILYSDTRMREKTLERSPLW